jgi:hypothetical protein
LRGIDSVTDRYYGIEVVIIRQVLFAVGCSCFHFGNNCLGNYFSLLKNIFQVLAYRRNLDPENLRHPLLGSPNGLAITIRNDLHASGAVTRIVKQKIGMLINSGHCL